MQLTKHQLEAIAELGISEGLDAARPLVADLLMKLGPIAGKLEAPIAGLLEAVASATANTIIQQLVPTEMDISTTGRVTGTIEGL